MKAAKQHAARLVDGYIRGCSFERAWIWNTGARRLQLGTNTMGRLRFKYAQLILPKAEHRLGRLELRPPFDSSFDVMARHRAAP